MRFGVYRVSQFDLSVPPCPGAEQSGKDDEGNPNWVIEVADLDALLKLAVDQGSDLIVHPQRRYDDWPSVTIYDDYNE